MKISISEAARQAGVSRGHLYRAYINTGILSVERDAHGKPVVDTAELARVRSGQTEETGKETGGEQGGQAETAALRMEVTMLREQLHEARRREEWLQGQVERLTLIEHRQAPAPRRGFFARLFGGAA